MSEQLWRWWDDTLTSEQRAALMTLPDDEVPPDLALAIWRTSGALKVIHGEPNEAASDGHIWRMPGEVADFVFSRAHENRHPEDFR